MTTSKTKTAEHTRRWLVWLDEYTEDDAVELWSSEGWLSRYVAEEFAEEYDGWDSWFPVAGNGKKITVIVRRDDGMVERFVVTGEFLPQYHAEPAEDGAL